MTEKEIRTQVAEWLNPYKGLTEGGAKHQQLIDIFNNSGLCTRYKMTLKDAWCATAASAPFIALGLTDIFPCVECSCGEMINLAKTAGIWEENDAYIAGIGDLILYDWGDSGTGDNTGYPDHVGIVQEVSTFNNCFIIIEGNKNDTVGTRMMSINGRYIRGFITPDYALAAASDTTTTTSTASTTTTKTTATSSAKLTVDGEIGKKTVTRLQQVLGTTADGFIDGQSYAQKGYWTSILSEACGWTGGASPCVKALQKLVGATSDGILGTKTAKATQQYLIGKGYSCGSTGADGIFGANSAKGLQTWLNDN